MKTRDFLGDMLKFSVPTVVSALVGVLVLPLISRVYPEAEYGYVSNFYSIGNMMMGIVTLGLDQAYIRFFNAPPIGTNRNGMFRFTLITGVSVTIAFCVGIYFFSKEGIPQYLFNDSSYFAVLVLGLYIVSLVLYRLLSINYRFSYNVKYYNLLQVSFILGNRLLFVVAIIYSTKYIYSALIMLLVTLAIDIYGVLKQRKVLKPSVISGVGKIDMLKYSIPAMPSAVIVMLNNSIAKLVLGGYGLRDEVGVFAIATSAANVFSVIPTAFAVYWGAFMYKHYETEKKRIREVHDVIYLLSIFLILGVLLFQDIIYLFLGSGYRGSQAYFMMIMLTPIFTLLLETTSYGISIAKKMQYTLMVSIIGCVVNYVTCKLTVPEIGEYGAALGISLSAVIMYVLRTIISQHYYISINSAVRTTLGTILIWALCVGNIVLSNNYILRLIIIFVVALVSCILYKDMIKKCYKYIKSFIYKRRK